MRQFVEIQMYTFTKFMFSKKPGSARIDYINFKKKESFLLLLGIEEKVRGGVKKTDKLMK